MRALASLVGAAAAGLFLLFPAPAAAGSLEVAPTTIELAPGATKGVLYVTNRDTQPIVAQVEAFDWRGDTLTRSDALMVSPPMARLMPGERQTVRLALPAAGGADERSYRLIVSELPDPQAKPSNGVRVLLRLSIPVFAEAGSGTRAALAWSARAAADGIVLTVRNDGARRAKLDALSLATPDGAKTKIDGLAYVLAHDARSWTLKAHAAPGAMLTVSGTDETAGAPLSAQVALVP